MFTKVVYMTVFVKNQEKALDFYTNTLGFEKRADNPSPNGRFLAVGLPGQDFLLVLWPGTPGRADAGGGQAPGSVVVETDDCDESFRDLQVQGVTFETAEPLDFPFGRIVIGRDPDGNRLQIVERPKR